MSDDKPEGEGGGCQRGDVAFLGPSVGPGRAVVRHNPDHTVTPGIIVPVREGQNIAGCDLVKLTPREDGEGGFDVETLHNGRAGAPPASTVDEALEQAQAVGSHGGPAMVNSEGFRDGWDRIFGGRRDSGLN